MISAILVFSTSGFSQQRIFFGVDLSLDWYELTNLSALTYFSISLDDNPNNPFVCVPPDEAISISQFNSIGFSEITLCFKKEEGATLHGLTPSLLVARREISGQLGYAMFDRCLVELNRRYGKPNENYISGTANTTKWDVHNFVIALSFDKEDGHILLVCSPEL